MLVTQLLPSVWLSTAMLEVLLVAEHCDAGSAPIGVLTTSLSTAMLAPLLK
eukprot:gene701-926_t